MLIHLDIRLALLKAICVCLFSVDFQTVLSHLFSQLCQNYKYVENCNFIWGMYESKLHIVH